jgi:hypothetical protein
MKMYGGIGGIVTRIPNLDTRLLVFSLTLLSFLFPRKIGWVYHKVHLDAVERRKIYYSCQESNLHFSAF